MVIKKLKKKKQKKGIGYILEAFVAAIVLFVFAFSHHAEAPETRNWNSFQNQIGANDLTYVMQKTEHTNRMLGRGDIGGVQTAFSGATDDRLSISGTIENTPIGESSIGFYTPDSDILTEDLEDVTSGDPCHTELSEIDSEYRILRTQDSPDSLEEHHGARIYIADRDPANPTGQDNERNYDTFWVDNGTECDFSGSEGPHPIDSYFMWGNKGDGNPNGMYEIKSVDPDSGEMTLYNASFPGELKEELERSSNTLNVETNFDSFNFPKENLNYDLIIFQSRDNLDAIEVNSQQIMEYQKDGSVLLLMNLQQDDLKRQFLNQTGLYWIGLNREPDEDIAAFTNSTISETLNEYFRSLRCTGCELEISPGGKVSSGTNDHLTGNRKMLISRNSRYHTEAWNSEEDSMQQTDARPDGLPSNNCDEETGPYTQADFEFPKENNTGETEDISVYNVPLGSGGQCSDYRGIGIDSDKDGDFTGEDEAVHLNDERIKINGINYRVEVQSSNEVRFIFDGDNRVELINYRDEFPETDIGRFARMTDIGENGISKEESKLTAATVLWLLEDDMTFGDPTSTDVTTTEVQTKAIGGIETSTYIPYKMFLRWSN